jgi:hypothetical protein
MADDPAVGWTNVAITQSVEDLLQRGPTIKIELSASGEAAEPIPVLAQIDTGAHPTAISPVIARRLGLQSTVPGYLLQEAGRPPVDALEYRVRIRIPSASIGVEMNVVGLPALGDPHHVLIGRNFLAGCRLLVDFSTGNTLLQIPPRWPLD